MNQEYFLKKARERHGDKYEYVFTTDNILSRKKIEVICPEHGNFFQKVNGHLQGSDCLKCGNKGKNKKTKEEFITRSKEIHGDRYDYSNTIYTKSHNKVKIICSIHGQFLQNAYQHVAGQGCPKCANTFSSQHETVKNLLLNNSVNFEENTRSYITL